MNSGGKITGGCFGEIYLQIYPQLESQVSGFSRFLACGCWITSNHAPSLPFNILIVFPSKYRASTADLDAYA